MLAPMRPPRDHREWGDTWGERAYSALAVLGGIVLVIVGFIAFDRLAALIRSL